MLSGGVRVYTGSLGVDRQPVGARVTRVLPHCLAHTHCASEAGADRLWLLLAPLSLLCGTIDYRDFPCSSIRPLLLYHLGCWRGARRFGAACARLRVCANELPHLPLVRPHATTLLHDTPYCISGHLLLGVRSGIFFPTVDSFLLVALLVTPLGFGVGSLEFGI